jgi:hypothetical protein
LITSNGLNIYASDAAQELALFRRFHANLKPSGLLITSFLTSPPGSDNDSPWEINQMDPEALRKQRVIFQDIIGVKWRNHSSVEKMQQKLKDAGFNRSEVHFDKAKLFPTILAWKS